MKVNGKQVTAPRKPQCQEKVAWPDGARRRCVNDGVACWVEGEFGRQPKTLCANCQVVLRYHGWKVTYRDAGNSLAPLESKQEVKE
jgi:hypothetical protein